MRLGGHVEYVDTGTSVAFTVRRKGEVIDERRVIDDTEVDPVLAGFIEDLLELVEEKEEEENENIETE